MILKYLEIQGFKSFPDKIRIDFDKGITAVVGPNGSGKSNISDAIRWVMGEQSTKSLRGAKMEDVIFTGTKTRKSLGFCEVSLCISDDLGSKSEDTVISRKYYRSGDSEYKINSKEVRLRDVNEFFMDTGLGKDGYACVGQGKIAEIVQSKSTQRREIFEEAAGISKYRYRKMEAEKKLSSAEENLLRLKDIVQELEQRIEPLKEQSKKAKSFVEYANEKKKLEVSLWVKFLYEQKKLINGESDNLFLKNTELQELSSELQKVEEDIKIKYADIEKELRTTEKLRHEKEDIQDFITTLISDIAVSKNDLEYNKEDNARLQEEIAKTKTRDDEVFENIQKNEETFEQLTQQTDKLNKQVYSMQTEFDKLSKKLDESLLDIEHITQEVNNHKLKKSQLEVLLLQLEESIVSDNATFKNNQTVFETKKQEMKATQKEFLESESLMKLLDEKTVSLTNEMRGYSLKLGLRENDKKAKNTALNEQNTKLLEINQKVKLLEEMENSLDGFAYSVKAVLNQSKKAMLSGILGTVAQLIDVEDKYGVAIETALGRALQNIVTDNETSAKNAIEFLKKQKAGRATFLPLTAIKSERANSSMYEDEDGYIGVASDLVKTDSKYNAVVSSLLGRTLIVEDINSAIYIAKKHKYKLKIVTLDGQIVNAGGSMTGGSQNKNEGILSRKADISKLKAKAKEIEKNALQVKESITVLEKEISVINAEVAGINGDITIIKEDRIRTESENKRIAFQLDNEQKTIAMMQQQLDGHYKNSNAKKSRIDSLTLEIEQLDKVLQENQDVLEQSQKDKAESLKYKDTLYTQINELKLLKATKDKDLEVCKQRIVELNYQRKNSIEYAQSIKQKISETSIKHDEILLRIESLTNSLEVKKNRVNQVDIEVFGSQNQTNKLQQDNTKLRQLEKEFNSKKQSLSLLIARVEERKTFLEKEYNATESKLWSEYELTKNEAVAFSMPIKNIDEANDRLFVLKSKIKALGSVNLGAIEEYEEVSKRYEFLTEQLVDVEKSKAELQRLIMELTTQMRDIFCDSFNKINYNFKEIFTELFGGGQAYLSLTEPENVLESGIDIFVEPPGKIIKSLSLLSGGEQSFVAIAIYFAILKVRPAPFCVLDEIEAALDDVNVSKYGEYLRRISDKTQFIAITHRRGTMEEADVLYGVTMQDEGVSKLLKLSIGEVGTQAE